MKITLYVNGSPSETIASGLSFGQAASKIRQAAPEYLGSGYDSYGNGFISADGSKELRLEED
jgi:hypothetical protein